MLTWSAGPRGNARLDEARRGEMRRGGGGESYSAGLTAQPRRESCQFRSDPRVRVPETAGLALVSTHPSGLSSSSRLPAANGSAGISSDEFLTLLHALRGVRNWENGNLGGRMVFCAT